MSEVSLKELYERYRVTRRVIQNLETAGLFQPTGTNKYGHLRYNEEAQKKLEVLLLYREFGFQLREIKELLELNEEELLERLLYQREKLKKEVEKKTMALQKLDELLNNRKE